MADIIGPWVEPKGPALLADMQERWRHGRKHHTTTSTGDNPHSADRHDFFMASNGPAILDHGATKTQLLCQDIFAENPEALEDLDVKVVDADIAKVLNAFINVRDNEVETHSSGEREHEETNCIDEYDDEEDVVELEFERAIKKLDHKHITMHCPKCNTQLTKVILRRKRKLPPKQCRALNLLGCLPCLSVFIPNGNCINMFGLFGNQTKKPQQTPELDENISTLEENASPSIIPSDDGNVQIREKAGCFRLFWIFLNKKDKESTENLQQTSAVNVKGDSPLDPANANGVKVINKDQEQHLKGEVVTATEKSSHYSYAQLRRYFGFHPPEQDMQQPREVRLDIRDDSDHESKLETKLLAGQHTKTEEQQSATAKKPEGQVIARNMSNVKDAKSIEVLKSIAYGGILECIQSLCLVAAAAASGATTSNIVALTLANVIAGLLIIGHNLCLLRDDGSNPEASTYQQLLGRRENFPLHATFAVLAFLIFGLIPPVTYAVLTPTSENLGFKMLAVGATSLLCVIMLAIGKAYADHKAHKYQSHDVTTMYYVAIGLTAATISFAVGHLIKKFTEDFGLYDASSPRIVL